jgi:hypothetical protein
MARSLTRRVSGYCYTIFQELEFIFQKNKKGYKPKACNPILLLNSLGWLMGLKPTTTGITIQTEIQVSN